MADDNATSQERVTDYDSIAGRFNARYQLYSYAGILETLLGFLGERPMAVLEAGCGTGHWLAAVQGGPAVPVFLAGIDPSGPMLARAAAAAPAARLAQARAEDLPWRNESFDRVFCVNALHHFSDRARFFSEARRVLRPGGGLLTIGLDPHSERDSWWVHDYFEETLAIDRARFAQVRTLRGEIARAGFAWAESLEADHIEATYPAAEALASGPGGLLDRAFTSQLTVLSDEEYQRGLDRIRSANTAAEGRLQLVSDLRFYATTGWLA